MRNVILIVLLTTVLNSCKNDDNQYQFPDDEIYFPNEGIYGLNILNNSTTKFTSWNDSNSEPYYSFMASVPYNTSLKVSVENTSTGSKGTDWNYGGGSDWLDYSESSGANEKTDIFFVYGQEVAITRFDLGRTSERGSAEIKFYKNDEKKPFRTKKITWEPN